MKLPISIITKLTRMNNNSLENKSLSSEIDAWFESKGLDVDALRQNTLTIMEMAEYGELDIDNIDSDFSRMLREYKDDY